MQNKEFELRTKLKIREVKADDAKDLHSYCFVNEELQSVKEELESDLEKVADGRLYRIVVDASGHAVANINMERHPFDPEIGKISRLTVAVPFRGFNIANRLIEAIYDIAAENEIKTLQVDIPKSETQIIEAYENLGFTESPLVTFQKEVELKEDEPQEAASTDEEEEESTQLDLGVNDEK